MMVFDVNRGPSIFVEYYSVGGRVLMDKTLYLPYGKYWNYDSCRNEEVGYQSQTENHQGLLRKVDQ